MYHSPNYLKGAYRGITYGSLVHAEGILGV